MTVRDPVCGMRIDPADAAAEEEYEGRTYHFCSARCHVAFREEPEAYVPPEDDTA